MQFQFTLKAARICCGYSVKEVAKKCNVRPITITKYEEDPRDISFDLLTKLLDLYRVPADLIYFGTELECIMHNRAGVAEEVAHD